MANSQNLSDVDEAVYSEENGDGSQMDNDSQMDESMLMEEEEADLGSILQHFFTEDKKDRNVVDVLLEIRRSIDTNNKIMLKMMGLFEKYTNSR